MILVPFDVDVGTILVPMYGMSVRFSYQVLYDGIVPVPSITGLFRAS
jgi:hypothetical protein